MRSRQPSIWRELGWGATILAIMAAVFLFVYLPR
jgi:hypothetical protein